MKWLIYQLLFPFTVNSKNNSQNLAFYQYFLDFLAVLIYLWVIHTSSQLSSSMNGKHKYKREKNYKREDEK